MCIRDRVQKVEMKDGVPVGELIINKKGEFLDSVTLADKVKGVVEHIFNYVTGKLTDVTFEVYAEEDIKAADGVSDDYYKKDELIATIKTDETGIAKLENLPLGKYYVKEDVYKRQGCSCIWIIPQRSMESICGTSQKKISMCTVSMSVLLM